LADLNAAFEAMYSPIGRPSIPPEKLVVAESVLHDPLGTLT